MEIGALRFEGKQMTSFRLETVMYDTLYV